ncbi:MAG: hypothetical protein JXN64_13280 [Spirochaetes bacterium]|nr:hypothetical protein [Spirochaetota bacterium]
MKITNINEVRKEIHDLLRSKRKFAELDIHGRIRLKQLSNDGNRILTEVLNVHKGQLLVIADIMLAQMERRKNKRSLWRVIKSKK